MIARILFFAGLICPWAAFAETVDFALWQGGYAGTVSGEPGRACTVSIRPEDLGRFQFTITAGAEGLSLVVDLANPRQAVSFEEHQIARAIVVKQAGVGMALETVVLGVWTRNIFDVEPPFRSGDLAVLSLRAGGESDSELACGMLRRQ